MKVTCLNTLDDICKAICDGRRVLCIDIYCPDAFNIGSMKVLEIIDYLDNNKGVYIFIALED
jgi:hypothetical protein